MSEGELTSSGLHQCSRTFGHPCLLICRRREVLMEVDSGGALGESFCDVGGTDGRVDVSARPVRSGFEMELRSDRLFPTQHGLYPNLLFDVTS